MQHPAVEINPTALRCLYVMSNIWLPNNLITRAISQLLRGHEAMLQRRNNSSIRMTFSTRILSPFEGIQLPSGIPYQASKTLLCVFIIPFQ